MRGIASFLVFVLTMLVLAGCGSESISFIDPENHMNDPCIWEYTESDLEMVGARKTANEGHDQKQEYYKKENVSFCGKNGEVTYGTYDGKLSYYAYSADFEGHGFESGEFLNRFETAYTIIVDKYGKPYNNAGTKTNAYGTETKCTVDTIKNDFSNRLNLEYYEYSFYYVIKIGDDTDTVFTGEESLKLQLHIDYSNRSSEISLKHDRF
jgi:hypothetical protein